MALAFLNRQQAREAFETFVLPGIQLAMENENVNRKHLHVVVLRPGVPYMKGEELPILFEYSVGNPADWEEWDNKTFDDFARAKAMISWRTGLPSREVVLTKPHLLISGDTLLWGSAVVGGVISAVSGVQPFFDEMFATMTSAVMIGEASYFADQMSQQASIPDFI